MGPVTFYAAANAATGLLISSGTQSYASSLTLSPANSTPTSISLSSSNNASTLGQNVTLTASVLPVGATGTVTFYDGASIIGSSRVSGQAALTTNLLPAGQHSIWAYYSGDSNYLESKSSAITEAVASLFVRSFGPALNYTPGSVVPSAETVADFNGDGIPDIAIVNVAGNDVVVLIGNGDGSFSYSFRYLFSAGQQPQGIAVGDFNMDGKPDIAAANSGSGDISVLLGNGDGTFQPAVNYASGGPSPLALAVGDFNNDGIPDLAVEIANGGKLGILLGNGDGTFKPAKVFNVGLSGGPKSLLVLDLNNDGKADLAATGPNGAVIVLIGNGDGTFQTSTQSFTGVTMAVTTGDFNLDGKPDLAVGTNGGLFILLGNGDGSLQPPIAVTVSDQAWDLAVGDFNGDGIPDLMEVNGETNLHMFLGNGDGTFQAPTTYTGAEQVSVADLNRDGRSDLVMIVAGLHVALGLLAGPPSELVFSTQPSNGTVGKPIAPVVVQVQDQHGDPVTQYVEGLNITSSPSGVLTAVNTQNGVGTFNSLVFNTAGTYTLTVSCSGLNSITSNQFTITDANSVTVSGQVTVSGTGLSGVTMNVSGSQNTSTTTNASGGYSVILTQGGTYTLSPTLAGYRFSAPVTFSNLSANQTANFTGVAIQNQVARAVFRDTYGAIRMTNYASSTLSYAGGVFASDPSAAEDASGNLFVTARDNYNSIWTNVYNPNSSTWAGWVLGGGIIQGVPALAVDTTGKAWIASRDAYNSYWLVSFTNGAGFGTWVPLLGIFSTDPIVTSCSDGSIYLIGKDTYNSLWSGHYIPGSAGFQGWQFGGGVIKGKPAATCGGDNAVYIVAEDNWNSNWMARVSGNTWTGWFYGGAITSVTPRIAAVGNSSEAVVILDPTNVVWRTTFTEGTGNGWQPWTSVGGVLQDAAPAAVNGQLYLAGNASNGDLWWWLQTGNQWTWIGNNGAAAGLLSATPR